jgi:hypothetical protein
MRFSTSIINESAKILLFLKNKHLSHFFWVFPHKKCGRAFASRFFSDFMIVNNLKIGLLFLKKKDATFVHTERSRSAQSLIQLS